MKTNNATIASNNATNSWGFKTSVQFKVAYRLAQGYGHLWAQGKNEKVETRTPTPSGAIRIEEEWVHMDPSTPQEAHSWASQDPFGGRSEPTPQWESGSGTFGVVVDPDGGYTMTYEGVLWVDYSPSGEQIDAGLVPGWWNWHLDPKGRGGSLGGAMRLACAKGTGGGVQKPEFIRLFEADGNFWRSGFVAGSRWYEWFPGAGPDMA